MAWPSVDRRSLTPNAFGIDGPVMSESMMPTLAPVRATADANRPVTVDLPTPPLPEMTAMTFPMWEPSLGFSFGGMRGSNSGFG